MKPSVKLTRKGAASLARTDALDMYLSLGRSRGGAPPAAFRSVFVGMKMSFVGIVATPAERAGVKYVNGLD